jgi:tRNA(Leu) C34 or U34 (ribose-2'-O)-methylase TrmL
MSSHAENEYLETDFQDGGLVGFGKESVGCPESCHYLRII